jgi:3-methyladenine DNA glycosylase/8-oxoguanine DNA glycosylase
LRVTPDARGTWPLPETYDFVETTRLLRTGPGDPTLRREPDGLWRSGHTPEGPVSVRITVGVAVQADAWGPGAQAAINDVPRWLGLHEAPWSLPSHPVTDRLLAAHRGLRGTDTRDLFEALVTFVLQQRVTWEEATLTWRRLCELAGDHAPGPHPLRLSPTPRAIRTAGSVRLRALGIGLQQVDTLLELSRSARAVARAAALPTAEASALLRKIPGIGPWTVAMALGLRLARPEPVPLGDFHIPDMVAWALAGEPRGTDARMLELLRPFEGQAFRVVRLLSAARVAAPKRGPRYDWRRR